jgi:hypothetical protein
MRVLRVCWRMQAGVCRLACWGQAGGVAASVLPRPLSPNWDPSRLLLQPAKRLVHPQPPAVSPPPHHPTTLQTMRDLLTHGAAAFGLADYAVVDCRYGYEHEGGRLPGERHAPSLTWRPAAPVLAPRPPLAASQLPVSFAASGLGSFHS